MNTVFTNGNIAFTKDLVFGLCVMAEQGWMPLSQLDDEDVKLCVRLLDSNPTFPFKQELDDFLKKRNLA